MDPQGCEILLHDRIGGDAVPMAVLRSSWLTQARNCSVTDTIDINTLCPILMQLMRHRQPSVDPEHRTLILAEGSSGPCTTGSAAIRGRTPSSRN
jgi:hypothetical protein